jgi:hypothetical protein
MSLVGSIAVHVNSTFSLTNCFVNAAECDEGLTHTAEENTRKKSEPRKNRSIVKANTREMKHSKG